MSSVSVIKMIEQGWTGKMSSSFPKQKKSDFADYKDLECQFWLNMLNIFIAMQQLHDLVHVTYCIRSIPMFFNDVCPVASA